MTDGKLLVLQYLKLFNRVHKMSPGLFKMLSTKCVYKSDIFDIYV